MFRRTQVSYFKNVTATGWKYIGENKHLNYFLNSSFPILILLVNIEEKKVYWVEFDINKTEKNNQGWSILVPRENVLNISTKPKIQMLVGDVIDYMSQIEYQWEVTNKIKDSSLVLLNVSRDEIEQQDISGFTTLLNRLIINDDMIKKTRGKISFVIDGYNFDEREIYEIPEVRAWVKKLVPNFKYWGYFLNMDAYIKDKAGLKFLFACYVDIKIVNKDKIQKNISFNFDQDQAIEFLEKLFEWLNDFTEKYKISEDINKEQTFLITNTLFELSKNKI